MRTIHSENNHHVLKGIVNTFVVCVVRTIELQMNAGRNRINHLENPSVDMPVLCRSASSALKGEREKMT